jgi:hypothetical protein
LEAIGFVWAQRNNKKGGKKSGPRDHPSSQDGGGDSEDSDESTLLSTERLTDADADAAALQRREGTAVAALEGAGREKLGLDRYIKKRRESLTSGGGKSRGGDVDGNGSGSGGGEDFDDDDPTATAADKASSKRRRVKNYMTKGRTDAWMRKYEEFRNKNLRGDFSWKDNVQLRAWVRQQRFACSHPPYHTQTRARTFRPPAPGTLQLSHTWWWWCATTGICGETES